MTDVLLQKHELIESEYQPGLKLLRQLQQLQIKSLIPYREENCTELDLILNEILAYPSLEAAEIHRDSNCLGILDLKPSAHQTDNPVTNNTMFCECCGLYYQSNKLTLCGTDLDDVAHLGLTTYTFFKAIMHIVLLLVVLLVTFSVYSLGTNIYLGLIKEEYSWGYLLISLTSKSALDDDYLYEIGCWLGLCTVVLWGVCLAVIKYWQLQLQMDTMHCSFYNVSEYSILIEKMPTGLSKEYVQNQLTRYFIKQCEDSGECSIPRLRIEKYNQGKPFYSNQQQLTDKQLTEILKEGKKHRDRIIKFLMQRQNSEQFSVSLEQRQEVYSEYYGCELRKEQICDKLINSICQQMKQRNQEEKTTVFITFQSKSQRDFILKRNQSSELSFLNLLKKLLPFWDSNQSLTITNTNGMLVTDLRVQAAPEPQDIVWGNIGVKKCSVIIRKLVTYSITLVLLGISFSIVLGLTYAKQNQNNSLISILISVVISVVNILISFVIDILTRYERDYTVSNYQKSLAVKSIIAQLINSILIPMMANYYIKGQNIFGRNGLTQDILILGLIYSLVAPITKVLDVSLLLNQLVRRYYSTPKRRLNLTQARLNEIHQLLPFEVGYEYIAIVNLFLFTCFFVSLQPILPLPAIVGLLLLYWAEKHSLFKYCRRPVPGHDFLSTPIFNLLSFGPVTFVLGNFTWGTFLPDSPETHAFHSITLPNAIALGIAFVIMILPYHPIIMNRISQRAANQVDQQYYQKNRIFFPAEYDRLNPSTAKDGIAEFKCFIDNKKQELQECQDDVCKQQATILNKELERKFLKLPQPKINVGGMFKSKDNYCYVMDKIASVHGFAEKKLSFTNSLVVGGVIQSQLEVFRSAKRQNATDRNFNEQLLHVNNSLDCTRNGVSLIISGKHAASHPPISINEQSHLTIAQHGKTPSPDKSRFSKEHYLQYQRDQSVRTSLKAMSQTARPITSYPLFLQPLTIKEHSEQEPSEQKGSELRSRPPEPLSVITSMHHQK